MPDDFAREVAYRRLDWTRLPLREIPDEQLQRILTWSEAQIARRGHCSIPISARVAKERVRGTTGRKCWRWVVYTWIPRGRERYREMRHGQYLRRHQAQAGARLSVALRWASELLRDPKGVEPRVAVEAPHHCTCRDCRERVMVPGLCAECLDAGCDATGESECSA